MAWAKFDDMFPWSRKVRRISDAAFRLHVSGIVSCARDLTDGIITQDDMDELPPMRGLDKRLAELVDGGLWHVKGHRCGKCAQPPTGAWVIHDYLDYNPTKADVDAEKAAARDRQRKRRLARAGVATDQDVTRDSRVTNGGVTPSVTRESHGVSQPPSLPDPSIPDPTRPVKEVGSSLGGNSPKQAPEFAPQACGRSHDPAKSCGACAIARRDVKNSDAAVERETNRRQRAADAKARAERQAEADATEVDPEAGKRAIDKFKQSTTKESAK